MEPRKFLAAGEWRQARDVLTVRNPYDGSEVGAVFLPDPDDVEAALEEAASSLTPLSRSPSHARARALSLASSRLAERREELARLVALEAGKPIKAALPELDRAAYTLRLSAEEATRLDGELLRLDSFPGLEARWALVRRFPRGVVLAITPFNFPVNLALHKIGPALAAGCPVVLKPSPRTPLTAAAVAELLHTSLVEAGLPPASLSLLPLPDPAAIGKLARDPRVAVVSFTGSAQAGWALKASLPPRTHVVLELGGNAGVVVDATADLARATERVAWGSFVYSGQVCISVQRVFVEEEVFEPFTKGLVERAENLVVGDPLDPRTDIGPLIDRESLERVSAWVEEALGEGARALTGAGRQDPFYFPTVLTGTRPEQKVRCEEVFGPVVVVEPVASFEEGLARVEDSPYGLQAGVFTARLDRAFAAFEALRVGGVIVNDVPTFRSDRMPYGGSKASGVGREGVRYAVEELTELRALVVPA